MNNNNWLLKVQDKNGFQRKKKIEKIKKINSYGDDDKKIESQGFH